MLEWLDEVSTSDPSQAVLVAQSALRGDEPEFAVAVRASGEARGGIKKYRGDDAQQVKATLEQVELALAAVAQAVLDDLLPRAELADKGKQVGTWSADARWARRALTGVATFDKGLKPLASLIKKHDKVLAGLGRIKDQEGKKYARAALRVLQKAYLATGWEDLHKELTGRIQGGWEPYGSFAEELAGAAKAAGTASSEPFVRGAREALAAYAAEHPDLLADE